MIDIHTHILPHMDDGSGSCEETLDMLSAQKSQGVTTVAATPHFYADNEDPEEFLARRDRAYAEIEGPQSDVDIILGAEVRYFNGCGRTKEMDGFKLQGTDFILLELPERHFVMNIIDDIMMLKSRGMRPIIAHLNRCKVFDDEEFIDFCNDEGILIQLNTECIIDWRSRKRSIELISSERVQFLATDCHDLTYRKPNKKEALDIIARTKGNDFITFFTENEEHIINGTSQLSKQ